VPGTRAIDLRRDPAHLTGCITAAAQESPQVKTPNRIVAWALGGLLLIVSTTAAAQARKAGEIIKDCEGCPEVVVVPPGAFKMGRDGAEPVRPGEIRRYEGPERTR
jgi:hypothetical protein